MRHDKEAFSVDEMKATDLFLAEKDRARHGTGTIRLL